MRTSSIYIPVSRVLAVVIWDGRRDPIYNLSMPPSGIGNRENRSGDPWIGHVSTCYQQLCRWVSSFNLLVDQSVFSFLILMQIFFFVDASAPPSVRTRTPQREGMVAPGVCRRRPPACRSAHADHKSHRRSSCCRRPWRHRRVVSKPLNSCGNWDCGMSCAN